MLATNLELRPMDESDLQDVLDEPVYCYGNGYPLETVGEPMNKFELEPLSKKQVRSMLQRQELMLYQIKQEPVEYLGMGKDKSIKIVSEECEKPLIVEQECHRMCRIPVVVGSQVDVVCHWFGGSQIVNPSHVLIQMHLMEEDNESTAMLKRELLNLKEMVVQCRGTEVLNVEQWLEQVYEGIEYPLVPGIGQRQDLDFLEHFWVFCNNVASDGDLQDIMTTIVDEMEHGRLMPHIHPENQTDMGIVIREFVSADDKLSFSQRFDDWIQEPGQFLAQVGVYKLQRDYRRLFVDNLLLTDADLRWFFEETDLHDKIQRLIQLHRLLEIWQFLKHNLVYLSHDIHRLILQKAIAVQTSRIVIQLPRYAQATVELVNSVRDLEPSTIKYRLDHTVCYKRQDSLEERWIKFTIYQNIL